MQELATDRGTSLWSTDHGALSDPTSTLDESLPHSHSTDVPWAMGRPRCPSRRRGGEEGAASPTSTPRSSWPTGAGLRHPMTVALPADESGVFSVIGYAFDAPSDERTVHVDRYGGQVVSTYGYDDYPAAGQGRHATASACTRAAVSGCGRSGARR